MLKNKYRWFTAIGIISMSFFIAWCGGHDFFIRDVANGFIVFISFASGLLFFACPALNKYDKW